ncbi:DUF551 domain-containing protein [Paraburkholderia tuberum]|uniref:DUF551 domain-containing protein n=1 Tax=Paraburkholderia tuberum TaxID=157910 RepID=A0A1H1GVZ7_9BURK|nr:DUF551 domain-containing protein [Paraburkholderia tuberum]SDR17331.1 Protein of unknown function [Paraburkholderia tuberum]
MTEWQPIRSAPENVEILTKIDDSAGARNEQTLRRRGNLWFLPDDSMYVYYTPTHWQPLPQAPAALSQQPAPRGER